MTTQKTNVFVRLVFIVFALAVSTMAGCDSLPGQDDGDIIPVAEPVPMPTNLPPPTGGMTLSVAGETITTDEIISTAEVLETLRPMAAAGDRMFFHRQSYNTISNVIRRKITDILLYHLARKEAPANIDEILDKEVKKEVNSFVAKHGLAKAEKIMRENYTDWDDFGNNMKKEMMIQSYVSTKIKTDAPISHKEMLDRYNESKELFSQNPEQIEFRLIEIQGKLLDETDINLDKGETPHDAAMRIAADLRKRIDKGEDFATLAGQFHGPFAFRGGKTGLITVGDAISPYDVLEKEAEGKKEGDIVGPIDADDWVFIMRLESRVEAKIVTFEGVQDRIEAQIRFNRRRKQHNKMLAELVEAAEIADMGKFTDTCVEAAFMRLKPE